METQSESLLLNPADWVVIRIYTPDWQLVGELGPYESISAAREDERILRASRRNRNTHIVIAPWRGR